MARVARMARMTNRRVSARGLRAVATIACLVCVVCVVCVVARTVAGSRAPSIPVVPAAAAWQGLQAQPYPRLANYNGLVSSWQVPFLAADNVVIARRGAPVQWLKQANPRALVLLYERTLQVDLADMRAFYGLDPAAVPPGWWLTLAGTRLTRAIDAHTAWVAVADTRPFKRCDDVLVGGESMHVWAVDGPGHRLRVARGYVGRPVAHASGSLIAPHYSYRTDLSNCSLINRRPWSFNLSSACPRWQGQTWADYLARRVVGLVRRDGWDGIFYDNLTDYPQDPRVAARGDGQADGGVVGGVNIWRQGQRALLAATRRLAPGLPLVVNGNLVINGLARGREMEAFPLIPGGQLAAAIDAYLADGASGLPATIVNPDSVTRRVPSLQAARLAIGVGLLGDGYTAYDFGWQQHGYPWWFDVYDGGAGSALARAVGPQAPYLPVRRPGRFRPGDVVLLDQEAALVRRVLPGGLVVRRGVWRTRPAPHPAGTSLTTVAQRRAGLGYLGRPRGAARVVRTASWGRYALPVSLQRGPATVDGRPQRAPVAPLGPHAVVRVVSVAHYDPLAVALTLLTPPARSVERTLVFWARGPVGQALVVRVGTRARDAPIPLALWPGWHRYQIPIDGSGRITLGVGRVEGMVAVRGVAVLAVQAFVLRRDFTHGIVLVNPTDAVQHVALGGLYRAPEGDQDPRQAAGRPVRDLTMARYTAAIVLRPCARRTLC